MPMYPINARKTPFQQMQQDESQIGGLSAMQRPGGASLPRPPMVPTNNPGATRSVGARPTPFQGVQQMQAQMQPGGSPFSNVSRTGQQSFAPPPGIQPPSGTSGVNPSGIGQGLGTAPTYTPGMTVTSAPPGSPQPAPPGFQPPSSTSGLPPGASNLAGLMQQSTIDNMKQQQIEQLLGSGPADTSQQEALIKQLMGDQIGQGLVDQRAAFGRAGGGFNGAEGAMEGDINRQAREAALEQIFGVRQQAQQNWLNDLNAGFGFDQQQQQQANQNQYMQELSDYLAKLNPPGDGSAAGGNGARTSSGGTAAGSDTGGYNSIFGFNPFDNPGNANKQVSQQAAANATPAATPPALAYYEGSDANFDYYTDETTGKVVKVKKSG